MGCCGDVNGVEAVGDVAKMMRTEYYYLKETSEMRRKNSSKQSKIRQFDEFLPVMRVALMRRHMDSWLPPRPPTD